MPPLRYTDDYRKLVGFYGSYKDYRPWTPAYALAVQEADPDFWRGDYPRNRDPAMNRPERLSLDELRFRKEAFPGLVHYDEEHETEARTSMTQPQHPGMAMESGMMGMGMVPMPMHMGMMGMMPMGMVPMVMMPMAPAMGMPMGMGEMGQAQINRELQMKMQKLQQQLSENEMKKEKKARYLSSSPEPYSRSKREQSELRHGNYLPTPKGRTSGYDDDRGPPEPEKIDIDGDEDLDGAGNRQEREEGYDEDLAGAGNREEVEEAEDAPLANNPLFNMVDTSGRFCCWNCGGFNHQAVDCGKPCGYCGRDNHKLPGCQRKYEACMQMWKWRSTFGHDM
jgi:hypothetical protein